MSLQSQYCPEQLQMLDHKGGKIKVADTGACLDVPPGALLEEVDIRVSVIWGNDYPPLQSNDAVIGPVISCQPDGLTFKKPVKITLPHSAKHINAQCITIWTKTSGRSKFSILYSYYNPNSALIKI